jgi:hypothetical protein
VSEDLGCVETMFSLMDWTTPSPILFINCNCCVKEEGSLAEVKLQLSVKYFKPANSELMKCNLKFTFIGLFCQNVKQAQGRGSGRGNIWGLIDFVGTGSGQQNSGNF